MIKGNVLLVDDDKDIVEVYGNTFKKWRTKSI